MKLFDLSKKLFDQRKKKLKIKKEAVKEEKKLARVKSRYTEAHRILIKPLTSEKITDLGINNQYVFEVAKRTNKIEIRKAIEAVYGVSPISIKIINVKGKQVRFGRVDGKTKRWKKAVVGLRQGDILEK
jgi:large subunit ribosomal protein L23